jgi:hypothetical protein
MGSTGKPSFSSVIFLIEAILKADQSSSALVKDGDQFPAQFKPFAEIHLANYEDLIASGLDYTVCFIVTFSSYYFILSCSDPLVIFLYLFYPFEMIMFSNVI